MNEKEMWQKYCLENNVDINTKHDIFKFCGGGPVGDELAELVLRGIKTATASSKLSYDYFNEEVPKDDTISIFLYDNDSAAGIIRNTKVSIVPFREVSAEHAYKEGEGDRSLAHWRDVHRELFSGDYQEIGQEFSEDCLCILEEFELIYGN